MFQSILVAFGFGNLALLGWLAAAAAPLLIHLWSRHRHREAPWAAMQFLLAAMRKNARRLQLQQWLLLALRTLIIALVVLAAAEPYGEQFLAGASGAIAHRVIVIDGSYSMAFEDDGISRLTRAKQMAAELVRQSRAADTFTIIVLAQPARTLIDRTQVDHDAVADAIDHLPQSHTGADLAATMALVEEALSERTARKLPDHREVYFFTDLQSTTWSEGRELLNSIKDRAAVSLIDVSRADSPNLAVTNVASSSAVVVVGHAAAFDVTLHQFGQQPRSRCQIELLVDDVPVSEQTANVPAGGDVAVRFTHGFTAPGRHTIAIRADGDNLSIDNSRWLVVPVREEVRVLCVAGRAGAARYIAQALNPDPEGDSPIQPTIISESELSDLTLADFDAVFLCNFGQLTSSEAERLHRYAAGGGGVVFFLGDRATKESYNAFATGGERLLPARIGELVSQEQVGLDPLEYRHSIVAPFRGRERAGLLTTPVSRYLRLEIPSEAAGAQVAVATRSGDPFIVTRRVGRGRTVLVATDGSLTSVDPASGEPWTHWPTWPSFLPIVRELLVYATAGQQEDWQHLVGTPLGGNVSRDAERVDSLAPKITRPDDRTVAASLQDGGTQWVYTDTDLSGIYSLSDDAATPHRFAVNVNTVESDLTKVDSTKLPVGLNMNDTAHQTRAEPVAAGIAQISWSRSISALAFVLLFVEAFLAWWFGRGAI